METDNVEDFASWMEPVEGPPLSPIPTIDEDTEDMYSDFPEDYHLPTSHQPSIPVTVAPEETNLDSTPAALLPATRNEVSTAPTRQVEDRPNLSLQKKMNITRDCLLQSIRHVNPDKLIKLLTTVMKEDTIHIQMDTNSLVDLGEHATLHNKWRSKNTVSLPEK